MANQMARGYGQQMGAPMNSWASLADDSALLLTPLSAPEVAHSLPAGSRLCSPTAEPVRSVLPLADFLIRSESYLQLTQIVPVCLSYLFGIDNSPIEVNKYIKQSYLEEVSAPSGLPSHNQVFSV